MDRKKLFKRLAILIFLIFIINFFANKFYWYSSVWYFDMLMHFLGGFWVGLAFLLFLFKENLSFFLILKIILGVLVIGFLWEVFEILVNNTIAQNPFNVLDTASDIFFDLSGGLFAMFYYLKRSSSIKENKVQ